jgi:Arc/MetJ-type ribon-helix-helix transcriptional regulator
MAREPVTVSLPRPLANKIKALAKRQHQSTSELVREALRRYLADTDREAAWARARAFGAKKAKDLGIESEAQLQGLLYEIRHGAGVAADAPESRRR